MALEATKNISGARQLTRALRRQLETISDYASPSFDRIISGNGGVPSDRVSRMLMKKERLLEKLSTMLELCLYFEEASQAELETIDNLEFKALVIDRFIYDRSWTDIALDYEGKISADALKKRFERCLKLYNDQNHTVHYQRYPVAAAAEKHSCMASRLGPPGRQGRRVCQRDSSLGAD